MKINNDPQVHKEYVQRLIAEDAALAFDNGNGVYKIKSDPRVTPVGSFLRRTSLDELPKLINDLRIDMSQLGPRPPIKNEVDALTPSGTGADCSKPNQASQGLWQVNGHGRVKFDDMVRLDIQYARSWSLLLDIQILLQTPQAVLLGEGAY